MRERMKASRKRPDVYQLLCLYSLLVYEMED